MLDSSVKSSEKVSVPALEVPRVEIRLSGSGGQGLLLAGKILAEAAGIFEGKYVAQTQSYGPEARGGVSRSEVIISKEEIDYPIVTNPDLLLALNQEACDKYYADLKKDGIFIVDSTNVSEVPTTRAYRIPITDIAIKEVGKKVVANVVALGLIVGLTGVVSKRSIREAVLSSVPKGTEDVNEKALKAGFKAADKLDKYSGRHVKYS